MKVKWIPVTENIQITDTVIVTRKINKTDLDVTIGLPGWGLQNNTVAYSPLPKNIEESPDIWKSDYRDDELPKKNKSYIVQLIGTTLSNQNKVKIIGSHFLAESSKWLRIPKGWEVIAWMEYPNPYQKKEEYPEFKN